MEEKIYFELNQKNEDNIYTYSKVLNKDINTIFNEALELYFKQADELLAAQSLEGDGANTNLDFHEFWDGIEIE